MNYCHLSTVERVQSKMITGGYSLRWFNVDSERFGPISRTIGGYVQIRRTRFRWARPVSRSTGGRAFVTGRTTSHSTSEVNRFENASSVTLSRRRFGGVGLRGHLQGPRISGFLLGPPAAPNVARRNQWDTQLEEASGRRLQVRPKFSRSL